MCRLRGNLRDKTATTSFASRNGHFMSQAHQFHQAQGKGCTTQRLQTKQNCSSSLSACWHNSDTFFLLPPLPLTSSKTTSLNQQSLPVQLGASHLYELEAGELLLQRFDAHHQPGQAENLVLIREALSVLQQGFQLPVHLPGGRKRRGN